MLTTRLLANLKRSKVAIRLGVVAVHRYRDLQGLQNFRRRNTVKCDLVYWASLLPAVRPE